MVENDGNRNTEAGEVCKFESLLDSVSWSWKGEASQHHLRQEAEAKGQNEARVAQANGGSRSDIHYIALVEVI